MDVAEAISSVHAALDLGVNVIDVAPFYGNTQAEAVLGQALHGVDRDRYVLATKVGRYGDDDFDFSAQRVVRSVDDSLVRLGTQHIDIVQCHDIEFADPRRVVEEALPALERLRVAGKVRFIGVTGYPLEALDAVAGRSTYGQPGPQRHGAGSTAIGSPSICRIHCGGSRGGATGGSCSPN